ncbi:hypothetical protein [Propionibacterium cyclohexanicum]|uniref:hypothetical protein n=1 Tax=Propionibacterium cyclohexanicum TaxID=64702 RepID=UPI00115F9371|nr:hypothetical protein [Propionibacterium cyclohexanicum]
MTDSSSTNDLVQRLKSVEEFMGDQTPSVRAFVRALRIREEARGKNEHPGITIETLWTDLVTILSSFEMRLNALEADDPPPK